MYLANQKDSEKTIDQILRGDLPVNKEVLSVEVKAQAQIKQEREEIMQINTMSSKPRNLH